MRAFVLTKYGGPSSAQLLEVSRPVPMANECLVKVHAAGLNPVDYKFRNGLLRVLFRPKLPFVMGNEMAGTIVSCGSEVRGFTAGERVFACCDVGKSGAFAEYVCVRNDLLARIPGELDFETASGVPLAGMTALHCLRDHLMLKKGERVLITGGAGGVGTFAIQIAKAKEAFVATTASPRGADLVHRLGADLVINYTKEKISKFHRSFDHGLDLVGYSALKQLFYAVKRGSRVLSVASLPEPRTARDLEQGLGFASLFWAISLPIRLQAWRAGVDYRYYFLRPNGADLTELGSMISSHTVHPVVDRVFHFEKIDDAFKYLEEGHAKGKVIVRMAV